MSTTSPQVRCLAFVLATASWGCALLFSPVAAQEAERPEFSDQDLEFFESKVRPLFVQHCYECHGPEADEAAGGLLMSSRNQLLKGGDTGPAFRPGKPSESLLIDVVRYGGVIEMPPDSKLSADEIKTLEEWVSRQAPWPASEDLEVAETDGNFDLRQRRDSHWCWQPLRSPALPTIQREDWIRDPLDRFILARLEERGLQPAAEADRATWIRRVTFDLLGLPPTPEQVQAFLADDSEQAYENVVDRLLDSPHFGERWARHWMDLVRYAETCGHEFDYPIPGAHHYRDYLIRSFNADVPYDQFVKEHLAGDLLSQPRRHPELQYNESIIGTGFWFLGEATHAPVDVKGDEAGRVDNQLDVMSKTFLGLTVACARCHDHKFDAISTRDYYALSGFLQSSRRQEALLDPNRAIEQGLNQLLQLEGEAEGVLTRAFGETAPATEHWAREVKAVGEVFQRWQTAVPAAPDSAESLAASGELVFADFEDGTYGDWVAEGTAFGSRPQRQEELPDYQGNVKAVGKFFINSHSRSEADGGPSDDATGTLTSPEFVIEHRYLHFRVGGGGHADKTCVQVLIDGAPVASQTGFNRNEMTPVTLELAAWQGKKARLRVVDAETGGWGNIGADFFVFSDSRQLGLPRKVIRQVAQEHGLPEARLAAWVEALWQPECRELNHPAHPLATMLQASLPMGSAWKTERGRWDQASAEHASRLDPTQQFLNTSDPSSDEWYYTGQAFAHRPEGQGNWTPTENGWRYSDGQVISSQRYGQRLWGVVRSPTFTINGDQIWYRLKGDKVQLRVVIDGYTMNVFSGLLFSDCSKNVGTDGRWQWVSQSGDLGRYQGHRAHLEIIDHGGGGFALSDVRFGSGQPPVEPSQLAARVWQNSTDAESLYQEFANEFVSAWQACQHRTAAPEQSELVNWALDHGLIDLPEASAAQWRNLADQARQIDRALPEPMQVQALTDGSGENEQVFIRGNHRLLGEVAPRQMLTALQTDPWPAEFPGSGRLRLAEEIASATNPLTSRVFVNRIWHHLFGRGIVASVDNFGVLGQEPTHPLLLDHLAAEFVNDGWSMKRLLKRIVLSQTYRLSSRGNADSDRMDPQNLLWHRANVRRLQGEAIRDAMLSVSGRLDEQLFGPSVAVHLTAYMQGRGRPGRSGSLDGDRRRSLYIETRRNFLSPMMISFDTPIPFSTVGRRNTSNVPAQALILMNDPFVYEEAGQFARRLLTEADDAESRIERMYWLSFSRPPTATEKQHALQFLQTQSEVLGLDTTKGFDDPRVWQDLCHVIWNVKEFTYLS